METPQILPIRVCSISLLPQKIMGKGESLSKVLALLRPLVPLPAEGPLNLTGPGTKVTATFPSNSTARTQSPA